MVHARPAVQEDQRRLLAHDGTVGHELRAFHIEEDADAVNVDSHGTTVTA